MTIPAVPMQLMVETKDHRAELHINGDITKGFKFFGTTFKSDSDVDYNDVAEALADLPEDIDEITVHINSYGGEVAEGVAIYNALRAAKAKVTTVCEGFACSIASVIFMAGEERVMRDSSLLMLHNASMPANGDANAHRKAADDLDVITELSKTAYLRHATEELTREKLTEIMDEETWVTPEQALDWGLATEVDAPSDEEEPSQSARVLVARSLTSVLPVTEAFDFAEGMKRIFTSLDDLKQLVEEGLAQGCDPQTPSGDPSATAMSPQTPIANAFTGAFQRFSDYLNKE